MQRVMKYKSLLAPILVPVLLSACVSKSDYDALKTQNDQLQSENQQLHQQAAADQAQLSRLRGAIKYTVESDLLFRPGSWEISPQGQQVMSRITEKLAPNQQAHIVVNGYTDNAPIGSDLKQSGVPTNEVLSQKRAESVMQFLISQGVKPDMISARGYGEAAPVAPNNTAQGRAKNRRVEFELAPPA